MPRDLVYAVMYNVDPDALEQRVPQFKFETAVLPVQIDSRKTCLQKEETYQAQ